MTTSFTRMDESTAEQWNVIITETIAAQPRVAEGILDMLRRLESIQDGFSCNQLVHGLQTATLAEQAGADDEVVVAALCHDIGKLISVPNHPRIAAEILRPYVRPEVFTMILVHQDFQGKHYYEHLGANPDAREQHRDALSADEWDQRAFDPDGETYPLEHFEPKVRAVFANAKML